MQIPLLLASAASTALAAITCNVPDNKPSSIPLDCQVCLDSIIISNNQSTWPTAKLALQEIKGRLVVEAAIPEHMNIPLAVETLELNGKFPKNTAFKKIITDVLEINKVESEGLIFDEMKPLVIKVDRSQVAFQGVACSTLSTLNILGSNLKSTAFHNLQKVGSLSMAASNVDIKALLPSLREAHIVNFSHMQSTSIELPITKITGTIRFFFNEVLQSIDLPELVEVKGYFLGEGFATIPTVNIPKLVTTTAIRMHVKTGSLTMPTHLITPRPSYLLEATPLQYIKYKSPNMLFGTSAIPPPYCTLIA